MTTSTEPRFEIVPLEKLHESPLNPRKHFDPKKHEELTASVRAKGVITPLLLRPRPDGIFDEDRRGRTRVREDLNGHAGYEIAAGHRRYRAARAAELADVPAVVREMDDVTFLEILIMENDEREDLHPLEEAEGYRTLITRAGYSIERIAERRGCSEKYVYDRVKLLSLIPEAQKLFRENKFTAGHAILLARLKPEDQKRALDVDEDRGRGGLFVSENTLWDPDNEGAEADPLKPVSVRELEAWIAEHVRFRAAEADPFLFPDAAAAAQAAAVAPKKERVVEITHESFVQDDARDGRTIRDGFWKRADGKQGSKVCDRAVTGVIVVGPGQGDAFKVCVDRERCAVHWAKEIKEREKRAAERVKGTKSPGRAKADGKREQDRWQLDQQRREAERKRLESVLPAIYEALAEKVKKASASAKGPLADVLLEHLGRDADAASYLSLGTSAEDLVRFVAFAQLTERPDTWNGLKELTRQLKPFGVDVAKFLAAASKPADTKEKKPAATKKPAQTSAKKKGKRKT